MTSSINENYYELLKVTQYATHDMIREAYKELARLYHPDSNFYDEVLDESLREENIQLFKQITEAYNVLSRPDMREEYDKSLSCGLSDWEAPETDIWGRPRDTKEMTRSQVQRLSSTEQVFGEVEPQSSVFSGIFSREPSSMYQRMTQKYHRRAGFVRWGVPAIPFAFIVGVIALCSFV